MRKITADQRRNGEESGKQERGIVAALHESLGKPRDDKASIIRQACTVDNGFEDQEEEGGPDRVCRIPAGQQDPRPASHPVFRTAVEDEGRGRGIIEGKGDAKECNETDAVQNLDEAKEGTARENHCRNADRPRTIPAGEISCNRRSEYAGN